jgi:hypothetical protein
VSGVTGCSARRAGRRVHFTRVSIARSSARVPGSAHRQWPDAFRCVERSTALHTAETAAGVTPSERGSTSRSAAMCVTASSRAGTRDRLIKLPGMSHTILWACSVRDEPSVTLSSTCAAAMLDFPRFQALPFRTSAMASMREPRQRDVSSRVPAWVEMSRAGTPQRSLISELQVSAGAADRVGGEKPRPILTLLACGGSLAAVSFAGSQGPVGADARARGSSSSAARILYCHRLSVATTTNRQRLDSRHSLGKRRD